MCKTKTNFFPGSPIFQKKNSAMFVDVLAAFIRKRFHLFAANEKYTFSLTDKILNNPLYL